MAFDFGFDFRGSSGYVTDPTFGSPVIGETYPTTYTNANGLSINGGWSGSNTVANRQNTNDPRIAGVNYISNDGAGRTFTIDLSSGSAPGAGSYNIDLAMGDPLAQWTQDFKVLDNATLLIDGSNGGAGLLTGGAGHFYDATLTDRTATTAWNGVSSQKTFATTTCKIICGADNSGGSLTMFSHFRLTLVNPSFDMGFDFRATAGYVTDPNYGTPVLGEAYPHTYSNANGDSVNAGWDVGISSDNNNATYDARIAGDQRRGASNQAVFIVDLSSGSAPGAGDYNVDLALGNAPGGYTSPVEDFKLLDNTTLLIDGTNGGAGYAHSPGYFIDATLATVAGGATWTGTPVSKTFATTTAKLAIAMDAFTGDATFLAHFRLTAAGGASTNFMAFEANTGQMSAVTPGYW